MDLKVYPSASPFAGLILAHGAGAGQSSAFMVRAARDIAERGITVATFDFPYIVAGRKAPDRAPVLEQAWRAAIDTFRATIGASPLGIDRNASRPLGIIDNASLPLGIDRNSSLPLDVIDNASLPLSIDRNSSLPLFIGGKSMGGRIASHVASQGGAGPLAGVVFFGYPLHPPGKPEQRRDAHLPAIAEPVLFIQGARDTFGTGEEIRALLPRLQRATLHEIAGGDHSFKVPGGKVKQDPVLEEVMEIAASWARGLIPT